MLDHKNTMFRKLNIIFFNTSKPSSVNELLSDVNIGGRFRHATNFTYQHDISNAVLTISFSVEVEKYAIDYYFIQIYDGSIGIWRNPNKIRFHDEMEISKKELTKISLMTIPQVIDFLYDKTRSK